MYTHACTTATQAHTVKALEVLTGLCGSPMEIQSDQGTHFPGSDVRNWSGERGIAWTYHIPCHLQRAGLTEQMNRLLKEQLHRLSSFGILRGWSKNIHQATAYLSDHPPRGSTPYAHFQGESMERPHVLRVQRLHPQACIPMQAMPRSAGLDLRLPHKEITLEPESWHLVTMGLVVTIPQEHYGPLVPSNSLALRGGGHRCRCHCLEPS